jgi:uncharacterized protein (TIGR03083 family)
MEAAREEIAAARRELADYLETIDDKAWNTQSLCDKWTVGDVVGHVTMPLTTPLPKIMLKTARRRFNFDKANDELSRERSSRLSRAQLIKDLRDNAEHPFKLPIVGHGAGLNDITVHTSDIRRPLGDQPRVPTRRAELVLDFLTKAPRGFVDKKRMGGLRFEATDVAWSHGEGPVVRGPAEALIMVMNGRAAALDDLEGDGVEILRSRFK